MAVALEGAESGAPVDTVADIEALEFVVELVSMTVAVCVHEQAADSVVDSLLLPVDREVEVVVVHWLRLVVESETVVEVV